MEKPLVSVICSVYNGEKYLVECIDSILEQSFTNFEFIIIDDGSIDNTSNILECYKSKDPRIKVHFLKNNQGLTKCLNLAIKYSVGKYIARMDADDIALPTRLEKQVHFMEAHTHIGILGSEAIMIDSHGKQLYKRIGVPINPEVIGWEIYFLNPFIHSSVMFRRCALLILNKPYDEFFITSQDYELWSRMLCVTEGANLSNSLICYRNHTESISAKRKDKQRRSSYLITQALLRNKLGIELSEDLYFIIREWLYGDKLLEKRNLKDAIKAFNVYKSILIKHVNIRKSVTLAELIVFTKRSALLMAKAIKAICIEIYEDQIRKVKS